MFASARGDDDRPDDRLAHSPSEAAELIGVSRTTVYSLLRSGQLRSVQIGSRRLIRREAIVELLDRLEEVQ